jgi:two-component system sensor histidine kinase KdpD
LLARALEQLGAEADRIDVTVASGLRPVRVDAAHIERVLVNLLENALKFSSPADRVDVSAGVEAGEIRVRVRDRGPGVAEADRERIFEPFERASAVGRGSGLGLAIAKGFAEANGGRVWLEPSPLQSGGSTFVLELPAFADHAALAR